VFDGFEPVQVARGRHVARIVVTLGTIGGYGFRRLLDRLMELVPADVCMLWQVGSTDVTGLPIDAVASLPSEELSEAMKRADVVVAHAGIGSALAALDAGRCPVLVPREHIHGEHVDDHQRLIAAALDSRGLAIHRSVESLTLDDLEHAASRAVRASKSPHVDVPAGHPQPSRLQPIPA
jgi:UDP-N-acetylglucosamine transferase subunit ALG13